MKFIVLSFLILSSFSCQTGVDHKEVAALYHNLGNLYFELENYEESAKAYALAFEYDAGLIRSQYSLARVYIEQKKYALAKEEVLELLQAAPDDILFLSTLGWIHYKQGHLDESIRVYTNILQLDAYHVHSLYNLAVLTREKQDDEQSLVYLRKLFELNHQDREALVMLVETFARLELWDDLLLYSDFWLEQDSGVALAHYYYGLANSRLESYVSAISALEKVSEIDEDFSKAYYELAFIYLYAVEDEAAGLDFLTKAYDKGQQDWDRIISMLPDLSDAVKAFLLSKELIDSEL